MHTSESVRKVAKSIVTAFAQHIKQRVKEEDEDYLNLGVDNNFQDYEELFKTVVGKVLGVPFQPSKLFSSTVIMECLNTIETVIALKGYTRFLENEVVSSCVHEVCLFILNKVKEEEFDQLVCKGYA